MASLARGHFAVPVQQPLQMLDDGIEGTVGLIGGTVQRQARHALRHYPLGQHPHQARLANARLATEQHHLAQAVPGLRPALPQQRHIRLPAHQRSKSSNCGHVQATLRGAFPHHLGTRTGVSMPLRVCGPEILADKVPLHQAGGRVTEHHRVGLCQALEAGGQVRRVAQRQVFVPPPTAHLPHHHEPGVDADPHRQPDPLVLAQPRIERLHGLHSSSPVRTARWASSSCACG